jgi:hypothetical protein
VSWVTAGGIALLCTAVTCGAGSRSDGRRPDVVARQATTVSSLAVVKARTPRLTVPRYDTSGTYRQVRGGSPDLRAVNRALRAAVLADQRAYAAYARREKPRDAYKEHGVYQTGVDRNHLSASTIVVSALMPLTREVFPGQHGGDGWLGVTVQVPSGTRVTITDLFARPRKGLPALATAYKARLRRIYGDPCLRLYPRDYTPKVANYSAFALTPRGLAVGTWEDTSCYRVAAMVSYSALLPYLSPLGKELVAGVRRPR